MRLRLTLSLLTCTFEGGSMQGLRSTSNPTQQASTSQSPDREAAAVAAGRRGPQATSVIRTV